MMQLANKSTIVVGLGRTGLAVARFLKNRGATVIVTDIADERKLGPQVQALRQAGIRMELGGHKPEIFTAADLVVISPGVPHTIAPVARARELGIPVMAEIELAARFIRVPIVAVTGTNGKTTTTELLADMLRRSRLNVFVGGNIGNPLIGYADKEERADVIVAEISSFQLDTIDTFRPKVAVLLNIAEDHLDRYPNFEAYAASKLRLFENQQTTDFAVLNGADALIRRKAAGIKSRKLYFSAHAKNEEGATTDGQRIVFHMDDRKPSEQAFRIPNSLNLSKIKLKGRHNLENACAAGLAAVIAGARPQGIQAALDQFQGLPHRLEYVGTVDGVEYFNDSKATNVDAVVRALECFSRPVVLVMGGLDKGSDFSVLRASIRPHTKKLIVMGRAANQIKSALGDITATSSAVTMADAVRQAYQAAAPGDVVLLSPGCASFDMYENYAQRGNDFKMSVENLKHKKTA